MNELKLLSSIILSHNGRCGEQQAVFTIQSWCFVCELMSAVPSNKPVTAQVGDARKAQIIHGVVFEQSWLCGQNKNHCNSRILLFKAPIKNEHGAMRKFGQKANWTQSFYYFYRTDVIKYILSKIWPTLGNSFFQSILVLRENCGSKKLLHFFIRLYFFEMKPKIEKLWLPRFEKLWLPRFWPFLTKFEVFFGSLVNYERYRKAFRYNLKAFLYICVALNLPKPLTFSILSKMWSPGKFMLKWVFYAFYL